MPTTVFIEPSRAHGKTSMRAPRKADQICRMNLSDNKRKYLIGNIQRHIVEDRANVDGAPLSLLILSARPCTLLLPLTLGRYYRRR